MRLTNPYRLSIDPVGDAMGGIYNLRNRQAVSKRVFGSHYDQDVKPIDIFACQRYLENIGVSRNWDCTCPAGRKSSGGAFKHSNTCLVTPEYAYVAKKLDAAPELIAGAIGFTMWYLNWHTWDTDKKAIKEMTWYKESLPQ